MGFDENGQLDAASTSTGIGQGEAQVYKPVDTSYLDNNNQYNQRANERQEDLAVKIQEEKQKKKAAALKQNYDTLNEIMGVNGRIEDKAFFDKNRQDLIKTISQKNQEANARGETYTPEGDLPVAQSLANLKAAAEYSKQRNGEIDKVKAILHDPAKLAQVKPDSLKANRDWMTQPLDVAFSDKGVPQPQLEYWDDRSKDYDKLMGEVGKIKPYNQTIEKDGRVVTTVRPKQELENDIAALKSSPHFRRVSTGDPDFENGMTPQDLETAIRNKVDFSPYMTKNVPVSNYTSITKQNDKELQTQQRLEDWNATTGFDKTPENMQRAQRFLASGVNADVSGGKTTGFEIIKGGGSDGGDVVRWKVQPTDTKKASFNYDVPLNTPAGIEINNSIVDHSKGADKITTDMVRGHATKTGQTIVLPTATTIDDNINGYSKVLSQEKITKGNGNTLLPEVTDVISRLKGKSDGGKVIADIVPDNHSFNPFKSQSWEVKYQDGTSRDLKKEEVGEFVKTVLQKPTRISQPKLTPKVQSNLKKYNLD